MLVDTPLPLVGIIDKMLWKFLIGIFASFFPKRSRISVGFKESSQRCSLVSATFKDSIKFLDIGIEDDHVVIGKVDLQSNDVWDLLMMFIMEYMPNGVRCRDVATIDKPFDFVLKIDFQSSTIRTLLNIFEDIFKCPK